MKELVAKHLLTYEEFSHLDLNDVVSFLSFPPKGQGDIAIIVPKAKKFVDVCFKEILKNDPVLEFVGEERIFLNYRLNLSKCMQDLLSDDFSGIFKKEGRVIFEFLSPNTNKPLHLGHLRQIALGGAYSNLLSLKHELKRAILYNDRGLHICKSLVAYSKNPELFKEKKGDHLVGRYYVWFENNATPELEEEAKECLRKWEQKDPKVWKLWKKLNEMVKQGIEETYSKYNIHYDLTFRESELFDRSKEIVNSAIERGIFVRKEDGAIVCPLQKYGLPDKVIVRKDGTHLYVCGDLALAEEKMKWAEISYNLTGNEQDLYSKQLFKILELLGIKGEFHHLSHGMVRLKEGKMSSRKGNVIYADHILEEIKALLVEEFRKRGKNPNKAHVEKLAANAVKFFILKYNPKMDIVFDYEKILSFQGESLIYVNYVYARINSIIKKANLEKFHLSLDGVSFSEEFLSTVRNLIVLMGRSRDVLHDSVESLKPNLLLEHVLEMCNVFNGIYEENRILGSNYEREFLVVLDALRRQLRKLCEFLNLQLEEEL